MFLVELLVALGALTRYLQRGQGTADDEDDDDDDDNACCRRTKKNVLFRRNELAKKLTAGEPIPGYLCNE